MKKLFVIVIAVIAMFAISCNTATEEKTDVKLDSLAIADSLAKVTPVDSLVKVDSTKVSTAVVKNN